MSEIERLRIIKECRERVNTSKIIILEGPQATGKTTFAYYAGKIFGVDNIFRGIPPSFYLETHTDEEIWTESERIFKSACLNNNSRLVFDRSVISLAAYRMRKFPDGSDFYLQRSVITLESRKPEISIVFLESEPQICLQRETRNYSILDSPLQDAEQEVIVYRQIYEILKSRGFSCSKIYNNSSIEDLRETVYSLFCP